MFLTKRQKEIFDEKIAAAIAKEKARGDARVAAEREREEGAEACAAAAERRAPGAAQKARPHIKRETVQIRRCRVERAGNAKTRKPSLICQHP